MEDVPALVVEVAAEVIEVDEAVVPVPPLSKPTNPRRRTSWIWPNTSTSKSPSSSMEGEKVNMQINAPVALLLTDVSLQWLEL